MIRWFKTRRALLKELAELQTAFGALAASFARHRATTTQTTATQRIIVTRLEAEIERMRTRLGYGQPRPVLAVPAPPRRPGQHNRPMPWQAADEIEQETDRKRREDR